MALTFVSAASANYGRCLFQLLRSAERIGVHRGHPWVVYDLGLDGALSRPSQHPENVWSLHGYVECLHTLGKHAEAAVMQPRLDLALARADPGINASCFCRVGESCCD